MSQNGCSVEHSEPYALRVMGDSMSPEFEDGHIIIVDPGMELSVDAFVVVEYCGEVLFGQYCCDQSGPAIHYLNPAWAPVPLADEFQLKGLVVQRSSGRRASVKHYDYLGLFSPRA